MDTGAFKAIELIVIVGAIVWFYSSQQRNLKRLKDEREAKQRSTPSAENAPDDRSD
jgi:hypothetical protein